MHQFSKTEAREKIEAIARQNHLNPAQSFVYVCQGGSCSKLATLNSFLRQLSGDDSMLRFVNIGNGEDCSIREIVLLAALRPGIGLMVG